ncbi:MAG: carbon starvation protein A [Verrucomicrobia bacterium]|nr:MAG: carbon starvation protein A [Verrucomicrobiota bacterium]
MYAPLVVATCLLLYLAYRFYGAFLVKRCKIDDGRPTPAETMEDGVDYVPTRTSVVFGHHFSSIAGSGPIVGPILAALYFGWGPAWVWIIVGSVFIGGVHDFGSMLMSVRNKGQSIATTSCNLVGPLTGRLFIIFVLFALIYVLVVFIDLTANTFANRPSVATASGWFVLAALAFGFVVARTRLTFAKAIILFVPITFLGLAVGHFMPAPSIDKNTWLAIVMVYAAIAAVMPVHLLLQPRDFLSSFFLYAVLISGIVGVLIGLPAIEAPAFNGWINESASPAYLIPALFITIACGACSGFHSIVASGTTSKQIKTESDIRKVGYGGMLVEGLLATLSLGTIAVLSAADFDAMQARDPISIFATGIGKILSPFGFQDALVYDFALLAVSTFLLTTLDTCTRLCRFLVEELFEWRSSTSRYLGTVLVLILPAFLVFQTYNGQPAWKATWPLFGSTNQLLAALALITFAVFLRTNKIKSSFVLVPAVAMLIMPLVALSFMAYESAQELGWMNVISIASLIMLVLGIFVSYRSFGLFFRKDAEVPTPSGG